MEVSFRTPLLLFEIDGVIFAFCNHLWSSLFNQISVPDLEEQMPIEKEVADGGHDDIARLDIITVNRFMGIFPRNILPDFIS